MGLIQGRPTRGVIKRFRDVLGRFRGILGLAQGIFGGRSWSKNRLEIDRAAEIFSHAGAAAPDPTLPDSEQLAGAELLHTGAHPRNLAFEMPGNRNGASDRGGDKQAGAKTGPLAFISRETPSTRGVSS